MRDLIDLFQCSNALLVKVLNACMACVLSQSKNERLRLVDEAEAEHALISELRCRLQVRDKSAYEFRCPTCRKHSFVEFVTLSTAFLLSDIMVSALRKMECDLDTVGCMWSCNKASIALTFQILCVKTS